MSGSTEAAATCRSFDPGNLVGLASFTPSSAAFMALLVKVVVTRSPPPSISSSLKNSPSGLRSFSSWSLTRVSAWPFWPPYSSSASCSGNFGSFLTAWSASSSVTSPTSAMLLST